MLDIRKLKELIRLMVENELTEIDLKDEKETVSLRREGSQAPVVQVSPAPAAPPAAPAPAPAAPAAPSTSRTPQLRPQPQLLPPSPLQPTHPTWNKSPARWLGRSTPRPSQNLQRLPTWVTR